jgi:hypothetical protein
MILVIFVNYFVKLIGFQVDEFKIIVIGLFIEVIPMLLCMILEARMI